MARVRDGAEPGPGQVLARALTALGRWARRLAEPLRSRATIVLILTSLGVLYLTSLLVPQRAAFDPALYEAWRTTQPRTVAVLEALGATDVLRSPVMVSILVLFLLSLTAVLADRLPRLVRRTRLDEGIPTAPELLARRSGTVTLEVKEPAGAHRAAVGFLEARGYAVWSPAPLTARGVRFRLAPLGFLLFHGSLALLLAAGIVLDLTSFSGLALVAEGEDFDAKGPYASPPVLPRMGPRYPEIAFRVVAVHAARSGDNPLGLSAEVMVGGEPLPTLVSINEPIVRGAISILIMDARPAPLFVCETSDGAVDGAFVKLRRTPDGANRARLDGCGLDVEVRLARRARSEERGVGLARAATQEGIAAAMPNGLEVTARRAGQPPVSGLVGPGGALSDPGGTFVLRVPEVRLAGEFQVTRERGGGLLWAGFLTGIAGLVTRLWLYRREIAMAVDSTGQRLLIAAASDAGGRGDQAEVVGELCRYLEGSGFLRGRGESDVTP